MLFIDIVRYLLLILLWYCYWWRYLPLVLCWHSVVFIVDWKLLIRYWYCWCYSVMTIDGIGIVLILFSNIIRLLTVLLVFSRPIVIVLARLFGDRSVGIGVDWWSVFDSTVFHLSIHWHSDTLFIDIYLIDIVVIVGVVVVPWCCCCCWWPLFEHSHCWLPDHCWYSDWWNFIVDYSSSLDVDGICYWLIVEIWHLTFGDRVDPVDRFLRFIQWWWWFYVTDVIPIRLSTVTSVVFYWLLIPVFIGDKFHIPPDIWQIRYDTHCSDDDRCYSRPFDPTVIPIHRYRRCWLLLVVFRQIHSLLLCLDR